MDFRRLVVPVFIAVAISVAAFIAVVLVAARLQDEAAIENERQVIAHSLRAAHESLAYMTEDNAWWDQAYRNVVIEENVDWIDRTYGDSVNITGLFQGAFVVSPKGRLIYANLIPGLPSPHMIMDGGLAQIVRTLPAPVVDQATNRSGLLVVNEKLLAFGLTQIQTAGIDTFTPQELARDRASVAFLSHLDESTLKEIGQANAIQSLIFSPTAQGKASLEITDHSGDVAGYLNWQAKAPGSEMINNMIIPAIFLLLLVIAAMIRFIGQASKLVQELESANKAKSAFLASTSHEIRTPLNAILGFTELISLELYGKVDGEKNKEYLKLIRESGEHLLSIINDILDISKLEAERFEIYAEKVDPLHVVASSCKIIQSTVAEKEIDLTTECEPALLFSDERIMRQVLINLLSNATKFTNAGGQIRISGEKQDDVYQLQITDTGIGMTEAQIEKALSLFGQVENEYARSHAGTGLGLPLVTRFMKLLDGGFTLTSKPGEGTVATLTFPLYRSPTS